MQLRLLYVNIIVVVFRNKLPKIANLFRIDCQRLSFSANRLGLNRKQAAFIGISGEVKPSRSATVNDQKKSF